MVPLNTKLTKKGSMINHGAIKHQVNKKKGPNQR